ncbi:MAG: 3-deoxy-D-manno-octulosonate 8-phosphate phosphatase [Polaribacter sp.]|nr:MAG: 3-deoxy-D-manno-octulosonate 8-phosphate phosphatase [Polaribacter sp.]
MSISYKEIFPKIDTLIFDVDGVLTNGFVTVFPDGRLIRQMNVKDAYALRKAIDVGYKICIISGGRDESVRLRLQDLGIKDIYLNAQNKEIPFNELVEKYNFDLEKVLYMGDDIPDFVVMEKVGMPCCPSDACREIQQVSKYVSDKKGGEGAVRDVIEQIMRVQGKWS